VLRKVEPNGEVHEVKKKQKLFIIHVQ